jgi:phosphocarrier protein HPr
MIKKVVEVKNAVGLHVRPAYLIVKEASKFKSKLRLRKDNIEVDGKSMMELMMLEAGKGTKLVIIADGSDEEELLDSIEKLFLDKFGEE